MWWGNYWGAMPLTPGLKKSKLNKLQNNLEFINHFETYFALAQQLFRWEGLPPTCDARFLERCLLLYGEAMIADVDGAFLSLASANGAGRNVYGYGIKGWGWGLNGYNREFRLYVPGAEDSTTLLKASDGAKPSPLSPQAVVCYDNVTCYPYVNYITVAAYRLADLLRSCDVCVHNLKTPYVISCAETDVNSVKEALRRRDENEAAIVTAKGFNLESFKLWPTSADSTALTAMWEQYRNIEAQLLEVLGVNSNDNTDKRERLLVDEVNANNETVGHNLDRRLHWRKVFCEQLRDAFGLDVSVSINEEVARYAEIDDVGGDDQDAPDDGADGGLGD